jgi:hypothetical protein
VKYQAEMMRLISDAVFAQVKPANNLAPVAPIAAARA